MSISEKSLNEIIEISKSDLSDLIIDDMKFGTILDNIHNQKKSSPLKLLEKTKSKKEINILSSIKKPVSKEIIKEESFSEEEEDEEEENKINNYNKKLFLNFENKNSIKNIEISEDESILDFGLKNCDEASREKSKEIIEKIFEFIEVEENDFQKYLLENKIIQEEKEENNISEYEEENSEFYMSQEENEELENKDEIKEENEIRIEDDKNIRINQDKNLDDFVIINKDENETKNNDINDINNYNGTKLYLIEKTENFSFLKEKEKDKSELIQYLNNNPYKDNISQENPEKYKIDYEILDLYKKEQLTKEFNNIKITCIFLDESYIYIGDGVGNLLIYSTKQEKLVKTLPNPFDIQNNKKLYILSIDSDENYIIAGYERGKIVVYVKNDKNIQKTKTFEIFNDITKEDIIEIKIYSKLNNEIIIYFADNKENVHKIEIIKNKIFKNKILEKKIITEAKNKKKIEPYYNIEINPFEYKCIGVVNHISLNIYIVNKFDISPIYMFPNTEENSFLSFCFSPEKSEKNKFYISNSKIIYMCELESDLNGAATLNRIALEDNIIKIGFFKNEFIYAYTQKNKIKLISFNENKTKDDTYQFIDTVNIDNNDLDINSIDNASFLIKFKSYISVNNGKMFLYHKNRIIYLEILSFIDGLNKLYNKTLITYDEHIWDILFKIIIEIKNDKHPIWIINDSKKFDELIFNYNQSYLSLLIIQLAEKQSTEDIKKIKIKFNQFMEYLIKINLFDFIFNQKKGLYPMLTEIKLNNFYFFLLEPLIIEDKFIEIKNIEKPFMINLIQSFLNKENEYIISSESWLSEILLHLPINNIMEIEKEIIEKYLINVIINIIINDKIDLSNNYFIDFSTPIYLIKQMLREKFVSIDLNKKELFVKENRYKDNIVLSNDYLRLKLIWYIVYILKNKILNEKENKKDAKIKTVFVKEILNLLTDEHTLYFIVYNEFDNKPQNEQSFKFIKEILYLYQLFLDNADNLSNYYEINKDKFYRNMKEILEKREEFKIYLKIFTIKNILKENITDVANDEKLNLLFYFMENNSELFNEYPEIKEVEFENNIIELLKLTDSITYNDSEKLLNLVQKCKDTYKQLGEYILNNFNKK